MSATTLLTGGAGYIGSHVAAALLEAGRPIVIVDDESHSTGHNVRALEQGFSASVPYHRFNVRDRAALEEVMRVHAVGQVVHLAAFKSVGESVEQPLRYFDNNLDGSIAVLAAMAAAGVERLVFSSSATVYGEPRALPLDEDHPRSAVNPYGQTKLMMEEIIESVGAARPGFRAINLRYFNPIGFHPRLDLREDGPRLADNLVPHILAALDGRTEGLSIFGDDYDTPDGTALRDYLHVMDVAEGHLAALDYLERMAGGVEAINLGRGAGVSVSELVAAFETALGRPVPKRIAPRRAGDTPMLYADPSRAEARLGWRARRGVDEMVRDSLKARLGAS